MKQPVEWKALSDSEQKHFILNGQVKLTHWLLNDTYSHEKRFKKEKIESYLEMVRQKKLPYYGPVADWLHEALSTYDICGRRIAVMGSVSPECESFCLHYGGQCTVIEYNKIVSEDPRIQTMTPDRLDRTGEVFDVAFSISSFEHDGLGRYGDSINPDGDLETMKKMKRVVKKNGFLFLAVPIGPDRLVWNAHRIYGRVRFPMLIKGWEIVDAFGWNETGHENSLQDFDIDRDAGHQPIFVLRNI